MSEQAIVTVSDLTYRYRDQPVLSDVDFTFRSGEYTVLIGPNGSGKSTLIRLILGLLPLQHGTITHLHQRQRIGYVAQHANQGSTDFPATVREIVASGLFGRLGLFRWMGKMDWLAVDQAIEQVDLFKYANRKLSDLSGGQQQRVFIARALANQPQILILDEPTVGVDAKIKEQFYQLLKNLHKQNLSILLVSHDLEEVIDDVDRVFCLNQRVRFDGTKEDFDKRKEEIIPDLFGVRGVRFFV